MRIDIHGHYTTAPPQLDAFRGRQITDINKPRKRPMKITDDEITQSLQPNFHAMDDRHIDLVLFSPRASGMGHDFGDALSGTAARKRADHETEVRAKYAEGALSLDTGTMRATLRKGEVAYVDRA